MITQRLLDGIAMELSAILGERYWIPDISKYQPPKILLIGFYPNGFSSNGEQGPAEVFDIKMAGGVLQLHCSKGCRDIYYDLTDPSFRIEDIA